MWDRHFSEAGIQLLTRQTDSSFIDLSYQREQHITRNVMEIREKTMKAKCSDSNPRNSYVTQEYTVEKSVPGFLCIQISGHLTSFFTFTGFFTYCRHNCGVSNDSVFFIVNCLAALRLWALWSNAYWSKTALVWVVPDHSQKPLPHCEHLFPFLCSSMLLEPSWSRFSISCHWMEP